ncbi:MAG: serine/threonine protein kinase [Chitinophagaceae bacterium]|nr:serine/threonine protein kinase [Chitinophagaceae bacterium]
MKTDTLKGSSADNQYQNQTFLTPGGMGDVYVADDTINNTKVAIKVIRITSDELRLLLEEEFKIAISLKHDNIVTTYYYGEFSDSTGNYFYSVMEYISKGSLLQKLSTEQASISIDDSLGYFYDLLKGLSEAHKTIIHRDLKPGNILVDENCRLKICDFGIAKYVDHLTRTKTLKGYGTFPYMSPECWMRESNSREMDIYSLGIIFFKF